MKSTADHEVMEQEWSQLQEDRDTLRSIFPTGNTKVCLPPLGDKLHEHTYMYVVYIVYLTIQLLLSNACEKYGSYDMCFMSHDCHMTITGGSTSQPEQADMECAEVVSS